MGLVFTPQEFNKRRSASVSPPLSRRWTANLLKMDQPLSKQDSAHPQRCPRSDETADSWAILGLQKDVQTSASLRKLELYEDDVNSVSRGIG